MLAIFEPFLFLLHAGGLIFWFGLHYQPDTGEIVYGRVNLEDVYSKQKKDAVIQATLATDTVCVFLEFAQTVRKGYP